jgi:hypothetical protein
VAATKCLVSGIILIKSGRDDGVAMSENAQDLTEALHNKGFELSGGTAKS